MNEGEFERTKATAQHVGTLGLIAFAVECAATLTRWNPVLALGSAVAAWAVVSGVACLVVRSAGAGGDEPQ